MTEVSEEEFEQVKAQAEKETHPPPPPREPLSKLQGISLVIALAVAIGSVLWFLVAALGVKFGVWPIEVGLLQMSLQGGAIVVSLAFIVSLIALFIQIASPPRRGAILAVVLITFNLIVGKTYIGAVNKGQGSPPIHDIQTDWDNPIVFPDAVIKERAANKWNPIRDNPVVPDAVAGRWPKAAGRSFRELQEEAYSKSNLKPVIVPVEAVVALEAAIEVAKDLGWKIESVDQERGLIHATETSTWYGFTDDIAIRVKQNGEKGSRVDVRSVSRIGISDLGANADRIKVFIDDYWTLIHNDS